MHFSGLFFPQKSTQIFDPKKYTYFLRVFLSPIFCSKKRSENDPFLDPKTGKKFELKSNQFKTELDLPLRKCLGNESY